MMAVLDVVELSDDVLQLALHSSLRGRCNEVAPPSPPRSSPCAMTCARS
jgi:hypothetical protein